MASRGGILISHIVDVDDNETPDHSSEPGIELSHNFQLVFQMERMCTGYRTESFPKKIDYRTDECMMIPQISGSSMKSVECNSLNPKAGTEEGSRNSTVQYTYLPERF
jgi:hypothetical protein